jgi:SRSO17 transposase
MRTSVAMSQIVKHTTRVRSGNELRREIAAPGALGKSPLPKVRLAMARSASVASSIGTFIFMAEDTWDDKGLLFRIREIFQYHRRGHLLSLVRDKRKGHHLAM